MEEKEKLSDEEIVKEVQQGNQDLYVVIMKRYENKLLRYAVNLIKDKDKVTDIVQESFIKAFVNLNGFDTKKKFSSWMYLIVNNPIHPTGKLFFGIKTIQIDKSFYKRFLNYIGGLVFVFD